MSSAPRSRHPGRTRGWRRRYPPGSARVRGTPAPTPFRSWSPATSEQRLEAAAGAHRLGRTSIVQGSKRGSRACQVAPPYGCGPALVGIPTCCNGANPYHGTSVVSWGCPAPEDTKGIGRRNRRLYGLLPVRRRSCYGTTIARLRVSVLPFASPISQMTVYVVFAWVRI